jgi:hypothetical protein
MQPESSAILTGLWSTLQVSTTSNNNLLYALHHLAPNPMHECLLPLLTTPPTNHQTKAPFNCRLVSLLSAPLTLLPHTIRTTLQNQPDLNATLLQSIANGLLQTITN